MPVTRRDGRKTYVLDTSVLLADPLALRRFDEHEVVLPVVVITELEGKRHHPELGYFARTALRLLDELRVEAGRLDEPVPAGDGGSVRVELNHTDPSVLPAGFRLGDNDSRILAVARNLVAEGHDVVLVSKDLPMRVKASAVGLTAEEYRAGTVVESGWTGMSELDVGSDVLDALYDEGTVDLDDVRDLPCHTGLVLVSDRGSALGRVTPGKQVRLVRGDREAFGLRGRSAEQRVALDLLLDPQIGIVSLGGRGRHRQERARAVRRLGGRARAAPAQEGGRLPTDLRRGRPGPRLPPGQRDREDEPVGAGRLRHPRCPDHQRGRRGGRRARPARGAAADPHPGALPARRVRHRRRGAVAGAQRAAHGALAGRQPLPRGAHP